MTIYSQVLSLIFSMGRLIAYWLFNGRKKKLVKLYQELNAEDPITKKWNQAVIPKAILLFPPIAFALTFLKINTDKSILDLLGFVAMGALLVSGGVFLNYLLSRGN